MKPYREQLIGLPLQRSVFADIDRAPALLGLTGVLTDDRLGAWLNDDGDLFLDRGNVDRLARALSESISEDSLERIEQSLHAACRLLQTTTDRCQARAPAATPHEARQLLGELGAALRALVPFGILSKFVPDVLYRAYASTPGAGIPRLPGESPGASLTREALALFSDCSDGGFPPDRLLAEWPRVPATIAESVLSFCDRHAGFGPLPWEAPGYEDPRYVFGVLQANFGNSDRLAIMKQLNDRAGASLAHGNIEAAPPELIAVCRALRQVIVAWIDFLERETWYVRRAFYVALLPLLARLVPEFRRESPGLLQEDTLFFELDELIAGQPDSSRASERRATYFGRTNYVFEHTISPARLAAVFKTHCALPVRSRAVAELV